MVNVQRPTSSAADLLVRLQPSPQAGTLINRKQKISASYARVLWWAIFCALIHNERSALESY